MGTSSAFGWRLLARASKQGQRWHRPRSLKSQLNRSDTLRTRLARQGKRRCGRNSRSLQRDARRRTRWTRCLLTQLSIFPQLFANEIFAKDVIPREKLTGRATQMRRLRRRSHRGLRLVSFALLRKQGNRRRSLELLPSLRARNPNRLRSSRQLGIHPRIKRSRQSPRLHARGTQLILSTLSTRGQPRRKRTRSQRPRRGSSSGNRFRLHTCRRINTDRIRKIGPGL